jgi:hypothetical protein
MAYDPTITTQFDGTRKLIYIFNIDAAGDGSAGTTTIDVSALGYSLGGTKGTACKLIALNKVWFNINPSAVADAARLTWDATSDVTFLSLNGYDDYDFSSLGGLQNTQASGYTGDVKIVIPAHTAGDTYSIVTEWLKYYN